MGKIRKALSAAAAALVLAASLSSAAAAGSAAALDGETSRTYRTLTDGVQYAGYVLGASSEYGVQEFSAVTFDTGRGDLRFDVLPASGGAQESGTLTDNVTSFARENGRRVIAAVSADLPADSGPAQGGYTVCRSGIVFSGEATSCSFGVAADGTALVGRISVSVGIRNRRTGDTALASAFNCLPQENAVTVYTDRSYAPERIPEDACGVVVDSGDGYALSPGVPVGGTVSAVISPGVEFPEMRPGQFVLLARGSARIAGLEAGDPVTLTADIRDEFGNTDLWRTVGSSVGGTLLVRQGEKVTYDDRTRHSATVIGVRPDGSAVMLASYGRQKGYSLGFTDSELAGVCMTLGMTDAMLLCADDSAMMLSTSGEGARDGAFEGARDGAPEGVLAPTGRAREGVVSGGAAVLSVECDGDFAGIAGYEEHSFSVRAAKNAGYSLRLTDGSVQLRRTADVNMPRVAAVHADTAAAEPVAFFAVAEDTQASLCSLFRQLEFDSTGEWLTLVIRESDIDAWYGKIFRAMTV